MSGAASSKTKCCALPTSGKTAQPNDPPFASPSIAETAVHALFGFFSLATVCSKVARADANFTDSAAALPCFTVATTSVSTKLPLAARPGPLLGSESSGSASMRRPVTSFTPLVMVTV